MIIVEFLKHQLARPLTVGDLLVIWVTVFALRIGWELLRDWATYS